MIINMGHILVIQQEVDCDQNKETGSSFRFGRLFRKTLIANYCTKHTEKNVQHFIQERDTVNHKFPSFCQFTNSFVSCIKHSPSLNFVNKT